MGCASRAGSKHDTVGPVQAKHDPPPKRVVSARPDPPYRTVPGTTRPDPFRHSMSCPFGHLSNAHGLAADGAELRRVGWVVALGGDEVGEEAKVGE